MAIKIFTIIERNFLVLIHSKLSSLIIILGPILLILLIGIGLGNTGIKDLNTNVYINERSAFTSAFLENLKARSFIITESDSLEDCINSVRSSDKSLCIELRKSNLTISDEFNISNEDIERSGIGYSVHLYTDFSKQRVVWGIINKVQGAVDDFSSNIRMGASERLKQKLDSYSSNIKERRKQISKIISLLNQIQDKIPDIKTKLSSSNINDINQYMSDLEIAISNISVNPAPVTNAFDHLKTAWENSFIDQNYKQISSSIDTFDNNIVSAKNELLSLDKELEDLDNSIESTKNINMNSLLNPIPMSYESISGDISKKIEVQFEFFDYLFPSFISFFIIFVSLILTTNFIIRERTSKAYIRNILSKTLGVSFIFGNFITLLLIVIIQCLIIIFIANFFLNIPLYSNILGIIITLILSAGVFISIGMILGYLFNSQETAIIASISLSLLLIIFSPLISPLETLPEVFKLLLKFTPLILTEDIIRRLVIFDIGFYSNLTSIIMLFITFIIFFLVANIVYMINKTKEIA